jgi:hypothetical protein
MPGQEMRHRNLRVANTLRFIQFADSNRIKNMKAYWSQGRTQSDASAIVQAAESILDSAAIVPSTIGNTLAIK